MLDDFLDFENFLTALRSVPLWQVGLELLVIGAVVYWVIRFLQGTRGARLLKGIIFLLISLYLCVRLLGAVLDLSRLEILFDRFLFYASFAIIIVFQPELRRALMRLGETRLFRGVQETGDEIEQIVDACATLSRRRIGALIALERDEALGSFTEEATRIDGEVSSALLQTIFFPNTALHDLGVIISGNKISYAGVQFPLAESGDLPRELGSRHRAAVGLSQETDALVIVVSEETGDISIADRGQLLRRRSVDQIRQDLMERMGQSAPFGDADRPTVILTGDGRTRNTERTTMRTPADRRESEGAGTTISPASRPPAATDSPTVARSRPPALTSQDVTMAPPDAPPHDSTAKRDVKPLDGGALAQRHQEHRSIEQVDLR
jgi:diadenylate cyclase